MYIDFNTRRRRRQKKTKEGKARRRQPNPTPTHCVHLKQTSRPRGDVEAAGGPDQADDQERGPPEGIVCVFLCVHL